MDAWRFVTSGQSASSLNKLYLYPAIDMVLPSLIQATRRLVFVLNIDMRPS